MTTKTSAPVNTRCAVRAPANEVEVRHLTAYLELHALGDAVRFATKDDDKLNAAVCAGQFDRVVFPSFASLLSAISKGDVKIDLWLKANIRIELANPHESDGATWEGRLRALYLGLVAWQTDERRRKTWAAILLSTLALIALVTLFMLIPPLR